MPQAWLITGGNGAGKSTFYRTFLKPDQPIWINADEIAQKLNPVNPMEASYEAAREAHAKRMQCLEGGESFCTETVFSHESKLELIQVARQKGYYLVLIYIHLDNPDLNAARVAQRVSDNGHDVPEHKVRSRLTRIPANIKKALSLVNEAVLYDNSSYENPFVRVARKVENRIEVFSNPIPTWAERLLF